MTDQTSEEEKTEEAPTDEARPVDPAVQRVIDAQKPQAERGARIRVRGKTVVLNAPSLETTIAISYFALLALNNRSVDRVLRDAGATLRFPTDDGGTLRFPEDFPERDRTPWVVAGVAILLAVVTPLAMLWWTR